LAALAAAPDDPPEAWKPWLEPLLQAANRAGGKIDLRAVLEALAARNGASKVNGGE
jgi:hypothetical protein